MYRKNGYLCTPFLMDHTAAQMNIVLTQFTFDVSKTSFYCHVLEMEQRHRQFHQYAAHLDGRVAGFRVNASGMGYAYCQVYVSHYFGEDDRRNLRDFHQLVVFAAMEADIFQCRSFDVGRREPVCHGIDGGDDILFVIYLLKTVFIIGYPTAPFQYGNRFLRLNLIAGIAAGLSGFYFFRSRNVKFAEYLFERLAD